MPNIFRLVTSSSADLANAENDHRSGQHHHRHGLFSSHRHHDSDSPNTASPTRQHRSHSNGNHHGSSSSTSMHPSSDHGDASMANNSVGAHSGGARHAAYPEALPSALSKRFTGPVVGTAVLDESMMPLEDAAILFEMVTPESTPLLKSRVKERFEAAINEVVEQRRQEARERAQQEQEQKQQHGDNSSSDAAPSPLQVHNNTFSYFKIEESLASAGQPKSNVSHHRRRHVLEDGGYFVFTDSYLSAHPYSVVTGVTSELQLSAADDLSPFHHRATGPDAEKQRLQEVKDYIREVEHEYRPLFRRRTSAMVYGRSQYMRTSSPDLTSSDVYYATPISDEAGKVEADTQTGKKTLSKLHKAFSSPLLL